jgi:excinuclease ABC subunit C
MASAQNANITEKLKKLPKNPGVYFHKNKSGKIIYVGKASNLNNRVRQYFQKSRSHDLKTEALVKEIFDTDWIETDSEIDALFFESEMIKRYMPSYNILLRDDKNYQYVRIDFKSLHPVVKTVRRPLDDGAEYYGPYIGNITPALKFLRKVFPFDYSIPKTTIKHKRPSLHYDIGLSPGLEVGRTSLADYKKNLRNLGEYLKGNRKKIESSLRLKMDSAAKSKNFESAAKYRDQLWGLEQLHKQVIFGDKEIFDISKDQALSGLQNLVNLPAIPRRIEGYDISHHGGVNTVASMVVFTDGVSDKSEYRKFKMLIPGNDDFAHMNEVITRRFSKSNMTKWPKPDLLLIDGGKGQVGAAMQALKDLNIEIPLIGLAKRFETIILPTQDSLSEVSLDINSHIIKLLQRIRDESHRFAVSYHTVLKRRNQIKSSLDEIVGIGPATKRKLLKEFGNIKNIKQASESDIAKVIGKSKAKLVINDLNV